MTNYERIKSMSIEELADIIMCPEDSGVADLDCPNANGGYCFDCVYKWLQKEEDDNA